MIFVGYDKDGECLWAHPKDATMVLDEDFNDYNKVFERLEDEMIDADKTGSHPKQVRGGVFSSADIPLIKKALDKYKEYLVQVEDTQTTASVEINQIANLLHRLNNRI